MERAKKDEPTPKKPHVSVAVEPEEMEAYQRAAKADARTFSSWVRVTLNRAAAKSK